MVMKVTESSQPGFVKGKSCFTKLMTFCNEVTVLLDVGRAEDVYLGLSKALDLVFLMAS